ncbi:MAG: aldose 1-epimerase family protein [Planctomycetaceae bacterium]|nr:aldose 1-epimerase family protein [Planctomycetaceae bacterium]
MSTKKWTLLDTDKNIYVKDLEITEKVSYTCPKSGKKEQGTIRVRAKRLSGGFQDGVDIIEIDNGTLRFTVCPTRGMGVLHAAKGNLPLKWDAPARGPIHPKFVSLSDPSGLGWLDGFNEWVVRCGLESNGAPEFDEKGTLKYPLHGRIANTPAYKVELTLDETTGQVTLEGVMEESRLFFKRLELKSVYTTMPFADDFLLTDTVTNLSGDPGEFEFLYHINTGMPLVSPGAKISVPFKVMAPRDANAAAELGHWNVCDPETPGSNEVVYFFEPAGDAAGNCTAMLTGTSQTQAFALHFNNKQLPWFCIWKSRLANGDGYVIGMEPCVGFPNAHSFEKSQGRVVPLASKESRSFDLRFEILTEKDRIDAVQKKIDALQGTTESQPRKNWGG